jgi:uncharacterized protein
MYSRMLQQGLREAMADTPVVFVAGARQTGKSTMVQEVQSQVPGSAYRTLDDLNVLAAARLDPKGFVESLPACTFLDEVQRAPELFLPIKAAVDRDRRPGRFVLTGSANVLALPRVADSPAGRMEILTLWPLAQAELEGTSPRFIDACFAGEPGSVRVSAKAGDRQLGRLVAGGYPEVVQRKTPEARTRWFDGYLASMIERDVRALAQIEGTIHLPRLLTALAARAGSPVNYADLGRTLAMNQVTLKRYLALLETLFLIVRLPAWAINLDKRLAKTAKIYFNDAGMLTHLLGFDATTLHDQPGARGPVVENFAVMELIKLAACSAARPTPYHFRTSAGLEVDLVLENRRHELVGIEIKAAATITESDFRGLRGLGALVGKRLRAGILLYTGRELLPFGERTWAVPLAALWSGQG